MTINQFATFLLTLLVPFTATAITPPSAMMGHASQQNPTIVINNRPLARINGKTISLVDVTKRMDLFITSNYPDLEVDAVSRFQFYQSAWKGTLHTMVENQLVIMAFEDRKIEHTETEIRDEMNARLPKNMHAKLASIQMTLNEFREVIKEELTVRKVNGYKAYTKAIQAVTPSQVENAYADYLTNFQGKDLWDYEVLTIRSKDVIKAKQTADEAYGMLKKTSQQLSDVCQVLKKQHNPEVVKVSHYQFSNESKALSAMHKSILAGLKQKTFSKPTAQSNKSSETQVYRIFYLNKHNEAKPETFEKISENLRIRLVNSLAEQERQLYIKKLKDDYNFGSDDLLFDDSFTPFEMALKQ